MSKIYYSLKIFFNLSVFIVEKIKHFILNYSQTLELNHGLNELKESA